jgi:anti-sigma-K factor RskA
MNHIDPLRLADRATGDDPALPPDQRDHLATCPECTELLTELEYVVSLAARSATVDLLPAPDHVWHQVREAIAAPGTRSSDLAEPAPPPTPVPTPVATEDRGVPPVAELNARRRRGFPRWLVAAVVGLLVGAGITAGVLQRTGGGRPPVVAAATLEPLPGETGGGLAEMVREGTRTLLQVQVETSPVPAGEYRELWLINVDGERMYSLGPLPADGVGSYAVPPQLAHGLNGFTIVDVSLEPDDGNPVHSRTSLVRGTLPS